MSGQGGEDWARLLAQAFPARLDGVFVTTRALAQRLDLLRQLIDFSDLLLLLTGPPGAGKSALVAELLSHPGERWRVCEVAAPAAADGDALLDLILAGYGLPLPRGATRDERIRQLERHLETQQRHGLVSLIVVDDVEQLADGALDVLRELAARFEGVRPRLLLSGTSEALAPLAAPDSSAAAFTHLMELPPLDEAETLAYVQTRLERVGLSADSLPRAHLYDALSGRQRLPGSINEALRAHAASLQPRVAVRPAQAPGVRGAAGRRPRWTTLAMLLGAAVGLTLLLYPTPDEDVAPESDSPPAERAGPRPTQDSSAPAAGSEFGADPPLAVAQDAAAPPPPAAVERDPPASVAQAANSGQEAVPAASPPEASPGGGAGSGSEASAGLPDAAAGSGSETSAGLPDAAAGSGSETSAGLPDAVAGSGSEASAGLPDAAAGSGSETSAGLPGDATGSGSESSAAPPIVRVEAAGEAAPTSPGTAAGGDQAAGASPAPTAPPGEEQAPAAAAAAQQPEAASGEEGSDSATAASAESPAADPAGGTATAGVEAGDTPAAAPEPEPAAPEVEASSVPPAVAGGTLQWLRAQPPGRYTVQLTGSSDRGAAERFVRRNGLGGEAVILRTRRGGADWFIVVLGSHATPAAARTAIGRLPPALRRDGPWLRPIADVLALVPR